MTELIDSLNSLQSKYSLVVAFAVVGATVWFSWVLSERVTGGRLHGSAIAILIGLLLAWYGGTVTQGKKGIADIPLLSGIGLMGGAMFRDIAIVATAFGVRYVPHVWGTGIGLAAALQLLAVLPHTPPRRTPLEPMLEFDRSEHPFRQSIMQSEIEHDRGIVKVPEGPGLGVVYDWDFIESNRTARHLFE